MDGACLWSFLERTNYSVELGSENVGVLQEMLVVSEVHLSRVLTSVKILTKGET